MKLSSQRAASPKFVVTLDGASKSLTEMDAVDTESDTLLAGSSTSARNVVRVKPQTQPLARLEEGRSLVLILVFSRSSHG